MPDSKKALADFIASASSLRDAWSAELDYGYPSCLPSFDEFVCDLEAWYEEVVK